MDIRAVDRHKAPVPSTIVRRGVQADGTARYAIFSSPPADIVSVARVRPLLPDDQAATSAADRLLLDDYAAGKSAKRSAMELNREKTPAPSSGGWGFGTINGNVKMLAVDVQGDLAGILAMASNAKARVPRDAGFRV